MRDHARPKRPPKTTILQFRVTAEERALIEAAAKSRGASVSEMLRAEARRMIGAPQSSPEERAAMAAAARALAGVSNNLNQATKAMHQGRLGAGRELSASIERTRALAEELRRHLTAAAEAEKARRISILGRER